MSDDPFFSYASNPSEVKTTFATNVIDDQNKDTIFKSKENSGKHTQSLRKSQPGHKKDHTKSNKFDNAHGIKDRSSKQSHSHKDFEQNFGKDKNFHEIHEKNENIKRPPPPPHHEKKPKHVDPKFRPPSMLNDIAFPKPLKINPNAPPGSFKIFTSTVPQIPKLAELYD